MSKDYLTPSKFGAPGSLNIDTRNPGRAVPAFKHFVIRDSDRQHYAAGVTEYKSPSGTTTGAAPRIYFGIAKEMRRIDNGTESQDTTFNDVVQGQFLADRFGFTGTATGVTSTTVVDANAQSPTNHFNGQIIKMGGVQATITSVAFSTTTGTTYTFSGGWVTIGGGAASTPTAGMYTIESDGVTNLIVGFGASTNPRIAYRDVSTDTTPWTTQTTSAYAQFWLATPIGGAGYAAVTDAGVAVLGEWRVSICPLLNDPVLASSWGNGIEVGSPAWPIVGLAAIGDSPVVGKGDGLWYYDVQTRRYENVLKHLEIVPHPKNGKVTEAVTGGVIYTTDDGHAFFFDGVSVSEVSPNKFWPLLSRDIGASRITAIADNGETIAMVTEAAYQTTQNANIVVNAVTSAGAATAMTTNLIDGSFATGSGTTLDSFTGGSFIDVWADIPFEGVVFYNTRSPNSTAAAVFDQVSYSSATDTFTADPNGFIDGTQLNTQGSLSYTAFPPSASNGVVFGKSINWGTLQQAVTFNYSSGTDITTAKYGMRIRLISGQNFDADTEIDEVEIIPARAGMPNGGIYSSTTNFTPRDRAGLMTHVYLIKRQHTTGFVPHDVYACNAYPGVWKMCWHAGRLGQASAGQNLGQSLFLLGRYRTVAFSESTTRDPVRTRYPILQGVGTTGPGPLQQIAYEWAPKELKANQQFVVRRLSIDTRFVQPLDQTEIFIQHDDQDIVSLGVAKGGPISWPTPAAQPCRYINLWIGFKQNAATLANAPYYVEPYEIEYDIEDVEWPKDRATQTPEAT